MISDKAIAEARAVREQNQLARDMAKEDRHLATLRALADASERACSFGAPHDVGQDDREAIRWAIAQLEGTAR